MAYRELGVSKIREVLRPFCLGEGSARHRARDGERPEDGT